MRIYPKRSTLAAAALLVFLAPVSGCDFGSSSAAPSSEEDGDKTDAIPVETLTVEANAFDEMLEVPATAEGVDEITVGAEAGGRILSIDAAEGDEVTAGAALLRIDTETDTAQINQLQNQLESARREYERTERLADEGLATPQQLEQAETTLEDARLGLERAKIGASKGRLYSPISGVVQKRFIDAGEYASPGAAVFELVDFDTVVFEGQIPERRVRDIEVGDSVEVAVPALEETFEGELSRRAVKASSSTGTYTIEVTVDNAEGDIQPGMSGRLRLVRRHYDEVIVVPREAILQGFSRAEAMLFAGDDEVARAELREVELGPSSGPNVVVLSGLDEGDDLIVRGHRGLVNSAMVRRVDHHDSIDTMRAGGVALDEGVGDEDSKGDLDR